MTPRLSDVCGGGGQGGGLKEGDDLSQKGVAVFCSFYIKNKLKSEIFNAKKNL